MKFIPAEPDINYLRRWVSEGGSWEIGLTQMAFGVRVRGGENGSMGVSVDLCGGADVGFTYGLLGLVVALLERFPEGTNPSRFARMLPRFHVKPLFNDPTFWPALVTLTELDDAGLQEAFAQGSPEVPEPTTEWWLAFDRRERA